MFDRKFVSYTLVNIKNKRNTYTFVYNVSLFPFCLFFWFLALIEYVWNDEINEGTKYGGK